jgi:quinate dehydrogenase
LGVRNALLRALRSQFPTAEFLSNASFSQGNGTAAGLVIGGGATTRSAAYALTMLGLSPIFLINRDEEEVCQVQQSMPSIEFIHLRHPTDVELKLAQPDSPKIYMAVGAIRE